MTPTTVGLPLIGWRDIVYAKDQPQYQALPVLQSPFPERHTISRWTLTWRERLAILCGRDLFLMQLVFTDRFGRPNPLQPILPTVGPPEFGGEEPVPEPRQSGIVPEDTTLA